MPAWILLFKQFSWANYIYSRSVLYVRVYVSLARETRTVRHGLLCSMLFILFLISSFTLGRQTMPNIYGNIVGRRGPEFSRAFPQYIQERSAISIYFSLTRHAYGGFCNFDELWISFSRGNLACERPSFVKVQYTTFEPFVFSSVVWSFIVPVHWFATKIFQTKNFILSKLLCWF